jgi:hypothetical protein
MVSLPRRFDLLSVTLAALLCGACGEAKMGAAPPRDCSEDDAYELKFIQMWDQAMRFYDAPDGTPGAVAIPSAVVVPEDERCTPPGLTTPDTALRVQMSGNHDWGSLVATYLDPNDSLVDRQAVDADGAPYDGISFWTKNTGFNGFTLLLDDKSSSDAAINVRAGNCRIAATREPPPLGMPDLGIDPGPGGYPQPGTCGNLFQTVVVPGPYWQFHTIPFSQFSQEFWPNRSPDGIDPSQIYRIWIRGLKDTSFDLWIDNFAWYREKSPAN